MSTTIVKHGEEKLADKEGDVYFDLDTENTANFVLGRAQRVMVRIMDGQLVISAPGTMLTPPGIFEVVDNDPRWGVIKIKVS